MSSAQICAQLRAAADPAAGKPRECRRCHSIYLFADKCPDAPPAKLMHCASMISSENDALSMSDILELTQDLGGEEWGACAEAEDQASEETGKI